MELKVYCVVFAFNYFTKTEVIGQLMHYSRPSPFSLYPPPATTLYTEPKPETILSPRQNSWPHGNNAHPSPQYAQPPLNTHTQVNPNNNRQWGYGYSVFSKPGTHFASNYNQQVHSTPAINQYPMQWNYGKNLWESVASATQRGRGPPGPNTPNRIPLPPGIRSNNPILPLISSVYDSIDFDENNCPRLPLQDSGSNPIMVGFRASSPTNYSVPYTKVTVVDFPNGQTRFTTTELFGSPSSPPNLPDPKENPVQIGVNIVKSPYYGIPMENSVFERALIARGNNRPRSNSNPFKTQVETLDQIHKFILTLEERDRLYPIGNKSSQIKGMKSPPFIILNQRFNLREPDSSEKSVLDAFYNFGTPSQEVRFGDLDLFQEQWQAGLNKQEAIDDRLLGRTEQEMENNIAEVLFQQINMLESYTKETTSTAFSKFQGAGGYEQQYDNPNEGQCSNNRGQGDRSRSRVRSRRQNRPLVFIPRQRPGSLGAVSYSGRLCQAQFSGLVRRIAAPALGFR